MFARLTGRPALLLLFFVACGEESPSKIPEGNTGGSGSPANSAGAFSAGSGGTPGASGTGTGAPGGAPSLAGQGGAPPAGGNNAGPGGTPQGGASPTAGSGGQSGGTSGGAPGTAGSAPGGKGDPGGGAGGPPIPRPGKTYVYVGTGDWGKSGGGKIRTYALDDVSLTLTSSGSTDAGTLPSFFTVNPAGTALYAGDEEAGGVRAFSIAASGQLSALNTQSSSGKPVYLSTDREARFLFTAHYNEGSVQVFGLSNNGQLSASVQSLSTGSQAHSILVSPDGKHVFVPNKGSNYIAQFKLESDGKLTPNTPPNVSSSGGPRHLTFHPSKPFAYVAHENSNTLRAFSYDGASGVLTEIDSENMLPSGVGNSTAADVRVEPTGKFVYASNRANADSSLAIFSINQTDGTLSLVGHAATHGNTPRNFGIHPAGRILLVANQDSNNVAAFRLDPDTGALTFVATTDVGDKAWCVGFVVKPE